MYKTIDTPKGKYRYKFVPIFEGIKPLNKEIANENLKLLKEVCDRNGLHFLLFFGTLLGAVREHDFIKHDEDVCPGRDTHNVSTTSNSRPNRVARLPG